MLKITNPYTKEVVQTVELDNTDSIHDKYLRAKSAQKGWAAVGVGERISVIQKFSELIQRDVDHLSSLVTQEMGKPIRQSRGEIRACKDRLDYFCETAREVCEVSGESGDFTAQDPLGVVVNISAWNYPYFVSSNVFIPALLCGNAVLFKPSEFTPLTGLEIEKRMLEAGVPQGVFQTITGAGDVAVKLLDEPINGVFFTGSYATGKQIAIQVAPKLIRTQLELGGKDPLYVTDDVDVASAAKDAASGVFFNAGQSCCSVERLYVHEGIYEEFMGHFMEVVKSFPVGDPTDRGTFIGPLARPQHHAFLSAQVEDARAKGGGVWQAELPSDAASHGLFPPTVITNATHEMRVMTEESFGPLVGVMKVTGDDDAQMRMVDTEYGLTASVFCRDTKRATSILEPIQTGTAYVNCCDRVVPPLPWSGRQHSGIGSTGGLEGVRAFVQPRAWHVQQAK